MPYVELVCISRSVQKTRSMIQLNLNLVLVKKKVELSFWHWQTDQFDLPTKSLLFLPGLNMNIFAYKFKYYVVYAFFKSQPNTNIVFPMQSFHVPIEVKVCVDNGPNSSSSSITKTALSYPSTRLELTFDASFD